MPEPKNYTIGRSPQCNIVLNDPSVSKRHAEISLLDNGRLLLTDSGSRNGTVLLAKTGTEKPLQRELVTPTDKVMFGDFKITINDLLALAASRTAHPISPEAHADTPPQGKNIVRCACGAPKVKHQRCGVCKQ